MAVTLRRRSSSRSRLARQARWGGGPRAGAFLLGICCRYRFLASQVLLGTGRANPCQHQCPQRRHHLRPRAAPEETVPFLCLFMRDKARCRGGQVLKSRFLEDASNPVPSTPGDDFAAGHLQGISGSVVHSCLLSFHRAEKKSIIDCVARHDGAIGKSHGALQDRPGMAALERLELVLGRESQLVVLEESNASAVLADEGEQRRGAL